MNEPDIRIKEFEKMAFGMFIHYGVYSQLEKENGPLN